MIQRDRSYKSTALSEEAIRRILGVCSPVPVTIPEMAHSLRVSFYPSSKHSPHLQQFVVKLRSALQECGADVIDYEQALAEGHNGRIGEGIVLITLTNHEAGDLAIDHVASLSKNTVVGIIDGGTAGIAESRLQKRVDSLVKALVWHMAHVVVFVDDISWTIGSMNGSLDTFSLESLNERVRDCLVPKLAAPVIPPRKEDFTVHENTFDPLATHYGVHVEDMICGSRLWKQTGLLASQTKLENLEFRNSKYRRIASAFLSWRTGMSYGFLARQIPTHFQPAVSLEDAPRLLRLLNWDEKDFYEVDGCICAGVLLGGSRYLVKIPEVEVICTRSGCEKTQVNPSTDLLLMSLRRGQIILRTPRGAATESDLQPSFDTQTILAHAVGNSIIASVMERIAPFSKFSLMLRQQGAALAHWHSNLNYSLLPAGYFAHGEGNPPVSCSTPQAAIFALVGKLNAFSQRFKPSIEYLGDLHIEPSHGINLTGESLVALANLILSRDGHLWTHAVCQ